MYKPGDYVVGYPNFFFDNGVKHLLSGGRILAAKNRDLLVNHCALESALLGPLDSIGNLAYEEGIEEFDYRDLDGLVVKVDTLGEKRPHLDGAICVLFKEKILWFWARNVRPVRLATGGLE